MYSVEVTCRNEAVDVATIKTAGPLDLVSIRTGAQAIDGARFLPNALRESEHARCGKCKGFLWFRLADGKLLEAIPGMFKVEA
jgi:hypothetical protein